MTPALPEILIGQAVALATPLPPESGGDYMAGRVGLLAMLAGLAAQEAERGFAARVWENGAIRALLVRARADDGDPVGGRAAGGTDTDLGLKALDAANAELRRSLIELHEAAEARADTALQTEILDLYVQMAAARRLDLSGP